MSRYVDAEQLYIRSLDISKFPSIYRIINVWKGVWNNYNITYRSSDLKLFGKSYSGLEYDYRGLLHVYAKLEEFEKVLEYTDRLHHWKELRDKHAQMEEPIDLQQRPMPIENVIETFWSMW